MKKTITSNEREVFNDLPNPRDGLPVLLARFRTGTTAVEWACEDGYSYLFDCPQDVILCAQVFDKKYPGLLVQTALIAFSMGLEYA